MINSRPAAREVVSAAQLPGYEGEPRNFLAELQALKSLWKESFFRGRRTFGLLAD